MKEKKTVKSVAKAPEENAGPARCRRLVPIVCAGVVFAALLADNVYLHVETARQAETIAAQAEQIGALCDWVEHASVQGKWNTGTKSVADLGRRIAEKFRAAGRKTLKVFRKADDRLNPQTDGK